MPPLRALPSTREPDVVMIPGTSGLDTAPVDQLTCVSRGVDFGGPPLTSNEARIFWKSTNPADGKKELNSMCVFAREECKRKMTDAAVSSAREESRASQTALSAKVGEAKKLKTENEAVSAVKRWMHKYVEADAERNELLESLSQAKKMVAESEKWRVRCGELDADFQKANRRLQVVEAEYEKIKLQLEGVKADYDNMRLEDEAVAANIEELRRACCDVTADCEKWKRLYEAEVANTDSDDLRRRLQDLTAENAKLKAWLAQTHEDKERFRKTVIELSSLNSRSGTVETFLKTGVLPSDALRSTDVETPEVQNVDMSETRHGVLRAEKVAWLAL